MRLRSSPERWGAIAQLLHWTVALLVIVLIGLGLWMQTLPTSPDKIRLYALHKSLGLTVLALMLLRIGWRGLDRRPPFPAGMPRWQQRLARLTHALLYLLLLLMPLSGWLYNSASNFALRWFGLFSLPPLVAPDPVLKTASHAVHELGGWILIGLLVVHVGAALKHHVLDRDDTLIRMLPFASRRNKEPPC